MTAVILAAASAGGEGPTLGGLLLPLVGMLVIFYLLLIRPQQKRQKEIQRMLESLRKGDRVLTTGGIYGTIVGMKDNVVVLKIADNVKVEVAKSAVASLVEKGS